MDALAPEALQVLELVGISIGLAFCVIVFATGLAEIGARFINTRMQ